MTYKAEGFSETIDIIASEKKMLWSSNTTLLFAMSSFTVLWPHYMSTAKNKIKFMIFKLWNYKQLKIENW